MTGKIPLRARSVAPDVCSTQYAVAGTRTGVAVMDYTVQRAIAC